ncbi:MAG: hypothetical protein F6K56_37190 [Moorea sp. SIO3G5]|nr:hypothetical protein [Moorena sp. SIO3G5]
MSNILMRSAIGVEWASCPSLDLFEGASCPLYSYSFQDSATPTVPCSLFPVP